MQEVYQYSNIIVASNVDLELIEKKVNYKIVMLNYYDEKNPVDYILLICGNILSINHKEYIQYITNILKSYPKNIQCCLIGIGSNFKNDDFNRYQNNDRDNAIKEFLNEVLSRSNTIAVRGIFTYKYCIEYLGYSKKQIYMLYDLYNEDTAKYKIKDFLENNFPKFQIDINILDDVSRSCEKYYRGSKYERDIILKQPYIIDSENILYKKLIYEIIVDGETRKLFIEVNELYAGYLDTITLDAALFAVIPFALRTMHNIICEAPISDDFLHNIQTSLIPNLCLCDNRLNNIEIIANSIIDRKTYGEATLCGFSGGVDAFYSLIYYMNYKLSKFKPTHLYVGNYAHSFAHNTIVNRVKNIAKYFHLPVIDTNTNISELFKELDHISFHAYKTLFVILSLRNFIKTYIYSSTYPYNMFSLYENSSNDTALYELLLINILSMDGFKIVDGGCGVERHEKVKFISNFDIVQKYLNVCKYPNLEKNCGKCSKCVTTQLLLDAYDKLQNFSEVFDIDDFERHKIEYIKKYRNNKYLNNISNTILKKYKLI